MKCTYISGHHACHGPYNWHYIFIHAHFLRLEMDYRACGLNIPHYSGICGI